MVCNATNGVEPPRDYLSIKKSKKGTLKQIVPSYTSLKNNYTLLWDMESNDGYLKIMAILQKFMDQAISTNTSYNPSHYPGQEVPASVLMGDILKAYQLGIKTLYYQNTYDGKGEEEEVNFFHHEPTDVGGLMSNADVEAEVAELLSLTEECESCSI